MHIGYTYYPSDIMLFYKAAKSFQAKKKTCPTFNSPIHPKHCHQNLRIFNIADCSDLIVIVAKADKGQSSPGKKCYGEQHLDLTNACVKWLHPLDIFYLVKTVL